MQVTPSDKAKSLALLSRMNSGQDWKEVKNLYELLIDTIGEEWALKAVQHAVLTEKWRPAPSELRDIAARLASPVPNEGDLYQEFWKAVQYGYGSPRWSHAILGEVVRRLGGWEYFRTLRPHLSDMDLRSIWFPRFMEAFKACVPEWTSAVSGQLALPAQDRDPRFRIGQPTVRPALAAGAPVKAIDAPRQPLRIEAEDKRSTEMPTSIRSMIRPRTMPTGSKPGPSLSREDRQRLHDEVSARANRRPTEDEVQAALRAAQSGKGVG